MLENRPNLLSLVDSSHLQIKVRNFLFSIISLLLSFNALSQPLNLLNFRGISVNGITFESTKEDVIMKFGEPDSISSPLTELDPDSVVSILHYSNISFYQINERVFFKSIFFNESTEIVFAAFQIILDYNTTSEYLKDTFPKSYEVMLKKKENFLTILPCYCDDEIRVFFSDKHIVQVEYIVPWLD